MSTASPACPNHHWKALYRAAVLETDTSVIPHKIFEAEAAVLARQKELFCSVGTMDEKECLEEALHLLHAFKTACEYVKAV